jgi:hypothetical protein
MRRGLALLLLAVFLSAALVPSAAFAETAPVESPAPSLAVADASQMTTVEEVVEEGMSPVYPADLLEGDYPVEVKSSSSMFRVVSAVLHVSGGAMTATMTMSGKGYLYVCPGTAEEAAAAAESARIPYVEDESGAYIFTVPVEALDAPIPCAAYSRNKALWYERTLLFRADSLPFDAFRPGFFTTAESLGLADGRYTAAVTLRGGSGRASVESPARLTVEGGACTAEIVWSSKNYDYMKVGGERILPLEGEDNSRFVVPVAFFDRPMAVIADTVAMSEPHEISYTLRFDSASVEVLP